MVPELNLEGPDEDEDEDSKNTQSVNKQQSPGSFILPHQFNAQDLV